MNLSFIATLAVFCATLPATVYAQDQHDVLADTLIFRLSNGAVIRHDQHKGTLRRVDETGRQTATARIPRSTAIEKRTTVALSSAETRLLVLHSDESHGYNQRHHVMILDSTTLREVARLPLGDCRHLQLPGPRPLPGPAVLLCYESPNPSDNKKTFAFVTLDVDAAKVTRWFDLGGRRHKMGLGLFHVDDTLYVRVESKCDATATIGRSVAAFDVGERPPHIIVLIKKADVRSLDGTGELWLAGFSNADVPKRIAAFDTRPESALLCGHVLTVISKDTFRKG